MIQPAKIYDLWLLKAKHNVGLGFKIAERYVGMENLKQGKENRVGWSKAACGWTNTVRESTSKGGQK